MKIHVSIMWALTKKQTIYRSLFDVTGITNGKPREDIQLIIDEINDYINSCSDRKLSLAELIFKLTRPSMGGEKRNSVLSSLCSCKSQRGYYCLLFKQRSAAHSGSGC